MHNYLEHLITVFLGYFAIMNPLANTAVFVSLTQKENKVERRRIALKALSISFCIIVLFAILGKTLFLFFGITLQAFRITGGVLVFIIGYHMLQGQSSSMHQSEERNQNIAVSPLAVPVLSGPGTIASTMSFAGTGGWINISITIATFVLLCVITYFCFILGPRLLTFVSNSIMDIVTRLMGLILAVIGTQMLIEGVYECIRAFTP